MSTDTPTPDALLAALVHQYGKDLDEAAPALHGSDCETGQRIHGVLVACDIDCELCRYTLLRAAAEAWQRDRDKRDEWKLTAEHEADHGEELQGELTAAHVQQELRRAQAIIYKAERDQACAQVEALRSALRETLTTPVPVWSAETSQLARDVIDGLLAAEETTPC